MHGAKAHGERRRSYRDSTPRAPRIFALAAVALGGLTCADALPPVWRVERLRVLALTAEPPEPAPGSPTEVRVHWADAPHAPARAIVARSWLCPLPPDGDPRGCLPLLRAGGTPFVLNGPFPTLRVGPEVLVGAPDWLLFLAVCPEEVARWDEGLGRPACPTDAALPLASQEGVLTYRRLSVREPSLANHNPAIDRVRVGTSCALHEGDFLSLTSCPGATAGAVSLTLFPVAGSAEATASGSPESLLASFFVDAGTLDAARAIPSASAPDGADGALTVHWTPPASGTTRFWCVLRDGRGGEAALSFTLALR